MAVVRITTTLIESVTHIATNSFKPQMETAEAIELSLTAEDVYERIYEPWLTHIEALPAAMFHSYKDITIVSVCGEPANLQLKLATVLPMPRIPDSSHAEPSGFYAGHFVLRDKNATGIWDDLFKVVAERNRRVAAVTARRDAFVEGVKKVLTAHSTLAPALKAWPPLWELIPDNYKEQHKKVANRKGKDTIHEFDTAALTSAITLIKLTK